MPPEMADRPPRPDKRHLQFGFTVATRKEADSSDPVNLRLHGRTQTSPDLSTDKSETTSVRAREESDLQSERLRRQRAGSADIAPFATDAIPPPRRSQTGLKSPPKVPPKPDTLTRKPESLTKKNRVKDLGTHNGIDILRRAPTYYDEQSDDVKSESSRRTGQAFAAPASHKDDEDEADDAKSDASEEDPLNDIPVDMRSRMVHGPPPMRAPSPSGNGGGYWRDIFPDTIECTLQVTFDDKSYTGITDSRTIPNFEWKSPAQYQAVIKYSRMIIDRIKNLLKRKGRSLDSHEVYLRYGSCHVSGVNDETKYYPTLSIDSEETMRQESVRQICGFIHQYPFQIFTMDLRCDYSAVQTSRTLASTTREVEPPSLYDIIRVQYNEKITVPRKTILGQEYVSRADLNKLTDPRIASQIIHESPRISAEQKAQLGDEVMSRPASTLQAVCIYTGAGMDYLWHLVMTHGHSDRDLPQLTAEEDRPCHDNLCRLYRQAFVEKMYKFFACEVRHDRWFHPRGPHEVVPIRYKREMAKTLGEGGFGRVYEVDIDPAHRGADLSSDSRRTYALKEFGTQLDHQTAFEREIKMLLYLGLYPHDHILTHITSWQQNHVYYILYEKANCNLQQYMDSQLGGDLSKPRVLWFLLQLRGLADALRRVHQFREPSADTVSRMFGKRSAGPAKPISQRKKPGIVGWHHDIKPQNILVFWKPKQDPVLKVSDFGAGKFSSMRGPVSGQNAPSRAIGTAVYFGPECDGMLDKNGKKCRLTRPLDMWSLGCVILEFLLWFVDVKSVTYNNQKMAFDRARLRAMTNKADKTPYFWNRNGMGFFEMNGSVAQVLTFLEEELFKDIGALKDTVSIIRDLLIIQPADRPAALDAYNRLDAVLANAEVDLREDANANAYAEIFMRNRQADSKPRAETKLLPGQFLSPRPMRETDVSSYGTDRRPSIADLSGPFDDAGLAPASMQRSDDLLSHTGGVSTAYPRDELAPAAGDSDVDIEPGNSSPDQVRAKVIENANAAFPPDSPP